MRRQLGEDEVLCDAGGAERLHRLVDDPARELGGDDLDRRDLDPRAPVADGVHQPRGLQDEQPRLLDAHARVGDPVPHDALVADRAAERDALRVRSTIISSARSATPIARIAWWMRPGPSRACAIAKPSPSPPSRFAAGTRTSS